MGVQGKVVSLNLLVRGLVVELNVGLGTPRVLDQHPCFEGPVLVGPGASLGQVPFLGVVGHLLGVDVPVATALVFPGNDGATGAVADKSLVTLAAGGGTHRHTVRVPQGGSAGIDPLSVDVLVTAALVFPGDDRASRSIGGDTWVTLVGRLVTDLDPVRRPAYLGKAQCGHHE